MKNDDIIINFIKNNPLYFANYGYLFNELRIKLKINSIPIITLTNCECVIDNEIYNIEQLINNQQEYESLNDGNVINIKDINKILKFDNIEIQYIPNITKFKIIGDVVITDNNVQTLHDLFYNQGVDPFIFANVPKINHITSLISYNNKIVKGLFNYPTILFENTDKNGYINYPYIKQKLPFTCFSNPVNAIFGFPSINKPIKCVINYID